MYQLHSRPASRAKNYIAAGFMDQKPAHPKITGLSSDLQHSPTTSKATRRHVRLHLHSRQSTGASTNRPKAWSGPHNSWCISTSRPPAARIDCFSKLIIHPSHHTPHSLRSGHLASISTPVEDRSACQMRRPTRSGAPAVTTARGPVSHPRL